MNFEFKKYKQYSLIRLYGDLVATHQSIDLLEKISEHTDLKDANFIIDLEKLNHINSVGLSALLNILNQSRKVGGDVVLMNIPSHLMKLLVITKLHSIFSVASNINEAIVHFQEPMNTEISS